MLTRKGRQRRGEIGRVALELFVERGVRGATTREIAQRAGIAEGTIYRHFKGKEEIALELFSSLSRRFAQRLEEVLGEAPDPRDRLSRLVRAFFSFAQEEPLAYAYIVSAHPSQFPRLPSGSPLPKDVFVRVLQEGMEEGAFKKEDENLAAAIVIGSIVRAIFFHQQGLIPLEYPYMVDKVEAACLRLLT